MRVALLLLFAGAESATTSTVEAVVSPVWVERSGCAPMVILPAAVRAYRAGEGLRYDVNIVGLATADDAARLEGTLRAAGHLAR